MRGGNKVLLSTIFCVFWDYPNEDQLSKITQIMMPQGTCWILSNFVKFVLNSSEQFIVHNNTCYNAIVGPLLKYIEKKKVFTEKEASLVVKDIVSALDFLHKKGTNSVFNKAITLSLELGDVLPC